MARTADPLMPADPIRIPPAAAALAVLLCALWGVGQVAMKQTTLGISPILAAGIRSLGAAALLLAWIAWRRIPVFRRDGTALHGALVGALFAIEFVLLFTGLSMTQAVRGSLLFCSAPFFVGLASHVFVPDDRLTPTRFAGLAAAFAGLAVAFYDRLAWPDAHGLVGDFLCLAAAFFWGITTVYIKATPLRRALPEKNLLYQLGWSALLLLVASPLAGEPGVFAPTPAVWAWLAYSTLIVAGASYLAWFWLVSRYRATTLHAFTFLTPAFGVLSAYGILGEPLTPAIGAALVLIAAGIVLVNRS